MKKVLFITSGPGSIFRISVRLRPVDFRNLSLLSHLYNNLDPNMTLTSTAPYVIPWRCVAIHVCYMPVPRDQIMYSLNASVVALCHSDLEQVFYLTFCFHLHCIATIIA